MTLFKKRLSAYWQMNYQLFKSVVDWTTFIYFLIPALGLFIFFYKETLLQGNYGFLTYVPLGVMITLLLLFIQVGTIRTFLEDADRLFLIQNNKKLSKLKIWSFLYTVMCQIGFIIAVIGLLSPILMKLYHLEIAQLIQLGLLLMASYLIMGLIHLSHFLGFVKGIGDLILAILLTATFLYLVNWVLWFLYGGIVVFALIYYQRTYIATNRHFEKQLEKERASYFKWQSMIFSASRELKSMQKPQLTKRKPLFLNRENRLFNQPGYEVVELLSKTLLRNRTYIWSYVRLIGITLPLYLALPWWGDGVLLIITYYMLTTWLASVMVEIKQNPIFVIYQISEERWLFSQQKLIYWLVKCVMLMITIGVIGVNLIIAM